MERRGPAIVILCSSAVNLRRRKEAAVIRPFSSSWSLQKVAALWTKFFFIQKTSFWQVKVGPMQIPPNKIRSQFLINVYFNRLEDTESILPFFEVECMRNSIAGTLHLILRTLNVSLLLAVAQYICTMLFFWLPNININHSSLFLH
jgi:hypothetical protein